MLVPKLGLLSLFVAPVQCDGLDGFQDVMKDLDEDCDDDPILGEDDCVADMLVSAAMACNRGLEAEVQKARDALPRDEVFIDE